MGRVDEEFTKEDNKLSSNFPERTWKANKTKPRVEEGQKDRGPFINLCKYPPPEYKDFRRAIQKLNWRQAGPDPSYDFTKRAKPTPTIPRGDDGPSKENSG